MVSLSNITDVVLLTCIGLGVWGCPSYLIVVRMGKKSFDLSKLAPILASAAEDMTVLMRRQGAWMDLLLMGRVGGLSQF